MTYEKTSEMISIEINAIVEKVAIDLETQIGVMRLSGMSDKAIKAVLMEDLATEGRIFGQLKNGLKNTTKAGIGRGAYLAGKNIYEQAGVKQLRWVNTGSKNCPDCEPREGRVETLEIWAILGEPKSGFSVCGHHCDCDLIPV